MKLPEKLKYTRTHEWVRVEGEVATVGITEHAQAELTDIVYVEPPKRGAQYRAGDCAAVVESVKAASDIYSPLSGEVVEVNEKLAGEPALLNNDPYGAGWIFKLRISNPSELEGLLDPAAYGEVISK